MLVKVSLGFAALVVGFLGGAEVQQLVAASDDPEPIARAIDPAAHLDEASDDVVHEDCPWLPQRPPYPVNENGMTYGSGAGIDEDDPGPDLIAAYGTNGRCGFIRATDRDRPHIPLYDRDGVRVIGTFRVAGGNTLTSPAPQPRRSTP